MAFSEKEKALRFVLDEFGVRYREVRGWQQVRCPDRDAHSHGDRNPSGSVNLGKGSYRCHACGLSGDGYDLLQKLMNMRAVDFDGPGSARVEEDPWI